MRSSNFWVLKELCLCASSAVRRNQPTFCVCVCASRFVAFVYKATLLIRMEKQRTILRSFCVVRRRQRRWNHHTSSLFSRDIPLWWCSSNTEYVDEGSWICVWRWRQLKWLFVFNCYICVWWNVVIISISNHYALCTYV